MTVGRDEQRYLDGEMTDAEATAFWEALPEPEQERLNKERRFEAGLKQVMDQDVGCPDAAWRRLEWQLQHKRPASRSSVVRWTLRFAAAAVVAAGVLFAMRQADAPESSEAFLRVAEANVTDFAQHAQTEQPTIEHVRRFLSERGFSIQLPAEEALSNRTHEKIHLLGARCESCPCEDVGEILFDCCGQPVKIVMAHKGGRAADLLSKAHSNHACNCEVQRVEEIGEYIVAVVGRHPSPQLLELLAASPSTDPT